MGCCNNNNNLLVRNHIKFQRDSCSLAQKNHRESYLNKDDSTILENVTKQTCPNNDNLKQIFKKHTEFSEMMEEEAKKKPISIPKLKITLDNHLNTNVTTNSTTQGIGISLEKYRHIFSDGNNKSTYSTSKRSRTPIEKRNRRPKNLNTISLNQSSEFSEMNSRNTPTNVRK